MFEEEFMMYSFFEALGLVSCMLKWFNDYEIMKYANYAREWSFGI